MKIFKLKHGGIPKAEEGLIEIKRGDTLSEIAKALGVTVDKLLELNSQITNRDRIYAGTTLRVPDASKSSNKLTASSNTEDYTIQRGDTLSSIAQKHGVSLNLLLVDNPLYVDNPNFIKAGDIIKIQKSDSNTSSNSNASNSNASKSNASSNSNASKSNASKSNASKSNASSNSNASNSNASKSNASKSNASSNSNASNSNASKSNASSNSNASNSNASKSNTSKSNTINYKIYDKEVLNHGKKSIDDTKKMFSFLLREYFDWTMDHFKYNDRLYLIYVPNDDCYFLSTSTHGSSPENICMGEALLIFN